MIVGTVTALTCRCLWRALSRPTLAVCDEARIILGLAVLPTVCWREDFRLELEIESLDVASCA